MVRVTFSENSPYIHRDMVKYLYIQDQLQQPSRIFPKKNWSKRNFSTIKCIEIDDVDNAEEFSYVTNLIESNRVVNIVICGS